MGQCIQFLRNLCLRAAAAPFRSGLPALRTHFFQHARHKIGVIQHTVFFEVCSASVGSAVLQIGKVLLRKRFCPFQYLAGDPAAVLDPGELLYSCRVLFQRFLKIASVFFRVIRPRYIDGKQTALYSQCRIEGRCFVVVIFKIVFDLQQAARRVLLSFVQQVRIESDILRRCGVSIFYIIRRQAHKHTVSLCLGIQALAALCTGIGTQTLSRFRGRYCFCDFACCCIVARQYQHRAGHELLGSLSDVLRVRLQIQPAYRAQLFFPIVRLRLVLTAEPILRVVDVLHPLPDCFFSLRGRRQNMYLMSQHVTAAEYRIYGLFQHIVLFCGNQYANVFVLGISVGKKRPFVQQTRQRIRKMLLHFSASVGKLLCCGGLRFTHDFFQRVRKHFRLLHTVVRLIDKSCCQQFPDLCPLLICQHRPERSLLQGLCIALDRIQPCQLSRQAVKQGSCHCIDVRSLSYVPAGTGHIPAQFRRREAGRKRQHQVVTADLTFQHDGLHIEQAYRVQKNILAQSVGRAPVDHQDVFRLDVQQYGPCGTKLCIGAGQRINRVQNLPQRGRCRIGPRLLFTKLSQRLSGIAFCGEYVGHLPAGKNLHIRDKMAQTQAF